MIVSIILSSIVFNAYASEYQCPQPEHIYIKPINPDYGLWFGPKMQNSERFGFGLGGHTPGKFLVAREVSVRGKNGWICLYGTLPHNVDVFQLIQLSENEKQSIKIADTLPKGFGFVGYTL